MLAKKPDIIAALVAAESGAAGLKTPAGRIDVVTAAYAIQVEPVYHWQAAIAIAAEQAPFLPGLNPRVHLFGPAGAVDTAAVELRASKSGVTVTWEVA